MSRQAIQEYLVAVVGKYVKSSRLDKSILLNHMQLATKLSRKQLIRKLKRLASADSRKLNTSPGAPQKYPRDLLLPHVQYLWLQMEQIASPRMHTALKDWLPFYETNGVNLKIKTQLQEMSVSTLERFLKEIRATRQAKKGLTSTSPARYMKNKIPINSLDAKVTRPGHTQADTVAHCGTTTAGIYVNSITLTDIYSTWTENRALFSKKSHKIRTEFYDIEKSIPFQLRAVNTDSGSEFLNNDLCYFMWNRGNKPRINFTRSRPYKKNDNCYVEQKNYTHVRQLFGYDRIEDPTLVVIMNKIYKEAWNPLQNFFFPSMKLKEKQRVGAKISKRFEKPTTAYQRLLDSPHLTEDEKKDLQNRKAQLNPFELTQRLEQLLAQFYKQLNQFKLSKKRDDNIKEAA